MSSRPLRIVPLAIAALAAPVAAQPSPSPAPTVDPALLAALIDERLAARERVTWKDGFTLQTAEGDFKLRIGGYTHFDARAFVGDAAPSQTDQFTFRRIRPELAGTVLNRAELRFLPDFAGGRATVQDAFVEVTATPALKVRFGKFKTPFGLERLQSATALVFVERGLPTALVPNRDLGVQLGGELAGKRVAFQLGVFNGVADGGSGDGDTSDDKELAARLWLTPFAPDAKSPLAQLGVGVAATYGEKLGTAAATDLNALRTAGQHAFFQYRAGTTLADTAVAGGTHWRVTGHGHWYVGRIGVLAEYVHSAQEVALGDMTTEVSSDAWQLAVNVVATGGTTSFKGTTPTAAFAPSKGAWGAVELAARYNELRVGEQAFTFAADPARSARTARAFGGGASWILGKALRFVADYELTRFEGGAADGGDRPTEHAVLARVQTVF